MTDKSSTVRGQHVTKAADADHKTQAVLAEYKALRDEITARSRDQLICVTASLVAVGTLLSTVASDPRKFSGLLVVAPWLLAVFGILWCDHAYAIHLIAVYIREEIEQKTLSNLLGNAGQYYVGWETYIQQKRDTSWFLGYINYVMPLLYFALPSVVVIIAYFLLRTSGGTVLPRALEWSFVGLGILLLVALIAAWRRTSKLT